MADPVGAVVAVHEALPAGAHLIILGGLAANAYRPIARLTQDADILIVSATLSAAATERRLLAAGFERPPGRRFYRAGRFQWRRLVWPSPDESTMVDLFFSGADEQSAAFIRSVATRAVATTVGSRQVRAATPEDVIVFKALAVASGTRGPKAIMDEDDIRSILSNRRIDLDVEYIRAMSSAIGVLRMVNRYLPKARNGRA